MRPHAIDMKGQFIREDPWDYFNRNYEVDGKTGCWNWTGTRFDKGYGVFKCISFRAMPLAASRASWILHNGPIESEAIFACHRCDNPPCVNPNHLFLGTCKHNMEDCKRKERINRGEDRPQHKLTEQDVVMIRRLRNAGMPWRKLAHEFNVSLYCIISAASGITWQHVDEPVSTYVGKSGRRAA